MFRMRHKATGVALAAAVIGGIALATPASAAELGRVQVFGDTQGATTSWGAGWDKCRAEFPATRSIKQGSSYPNTSPTDEVEWSTYWTCYNTTNAT